MKIEVQVGFCPDIPNVIDMCIRSTIRTRYGFEVTTKLKLIEHREINIIYFEFYICSRRDELL